MNPKSLIKIPILATGIKMLWNWDARQKVKLIEPFLQKKSEILDVGSGPGTVSRLLMKIGLNPVMLDVEDQSFYPETKAILYNGQTFPLKNDYFDVVLLLTVLHHANEPNQLINEAARTGKRIIIIEDLYTNKVQEKLTHWIDSLVNLEFRNHPHNNRKDSAWKATFSAMNLKLVHEHQYRFMLFFRQVVYVLEGEH